MSASIVGLCLLIAVHSVHCETASAQRLRARLRAQIEARQAARLRPPAIAAGDQDPAAVAPDSAAPAGVPRILATPMPGQRPLPNQRIAAQRPADQDGESQARGGQTKSPGTFGIEVLPVTSGQFRGMQVQGFSPGSHAPGVGIQVGDLIVSIDGVRTESLDAVAAAQRQSVPGEPAVVHVLRDGRLYQTHLLPMAGTEARPSAASAAGEPAQANGDAADPARSAVKPAVPDQPAGSTWPRPRASLGIDARDATPHRGVVVVTARAGAAGAIAGLKPDDRIVSVAGRLVRNTSSLVREIAVLSPGDTVTFGVVRGQSMQEIEVEMGDPNGLLAGSPTQETELPPAEATLNPEKAAAATTKTERAPAMSGQSLLEGVGSVLGDFFSGEAAKKIDSPPPTPTPADADSIPADPLALPEDTAPDAAVEDTLPAPVETP